MGDPLPRLKQRLSDLAESLRFEEAARLRDRIDALEHVVERLVRLQRLRETDACLIAPSLEAGSRTAFFIRGGTICVRHPMPRGADALVEIQAGLDVVQALPHSTGPLSCEQAEDMVLIEGFVRRPPLEMAVLPLDLHAIRHHLEYRSGT